MPDKMSDMDLLVFSLKEPLMELVSQGLISERQADERSRNQAMSLGAYLNVIRLDGLVKGLFE